MPRQSRLMVRVAFVGVVLRDILCCCIMVSFLFMVKLQRTIAEASGLELTAISRQSRLMVRVAFVGVVLRVSFLFIVQ